MDSQTASFDDFPKTGNGFILTQEVSDYTIGPPGALFYHSSALLDIRNVTEKGRLGGSVS